MPEAVTKQCPNCKRVKRVDEFGWSRRKNRPTRYCKACWNEPTHAREIGGSESAKELMLYYADLRYLMEKIAETVAEAAKDGGPLDRPIASLGDVWLSEMTEEAYRGIIQALIRKAQSGDAVAAKLLLEERHRRLGEPTPESVESAFEQLFSLDPLTLGLDSE
jgi:hypothetical protein